MVVLHAQDWPPATKTNPQPTILRVWQVAMLPLGWHRALFPATFWGIFAYNFATVRETFWLIREHGIDGAAERQAKLG